MTHPPTGGPEWPDGPAQPGFDPGTPPPPGYPGHPGYPGYPPQAYQGYPPQGHPPPHYPGYGGPTGPPRPNHTARNVLLIVVAVVVLLCGGATVAVIAVVSTARDAIDEVFTTDYPGSESDPLTVEEGEAFRIRDIDYAAGWAVDAATPPDDSVSGLVATSDRAESTSESVSLTFQLARDGTIVGEFLCTGDSRIRPGNSVELDCFSTGDVEEVWDTIEVHDNSFFE